MFSDIFLVFFTDILVFGKPVLCELSDDTIFVGVSELFGELLNIVRAKRCLGLITSTELGLDLSTALSRRRRTS